MAIIDKIKDKYKQWKALRTAKKLEKEHVPSKKEILSQQKEFLEESKELKFMITKKSNKKNKTKPINKTKTNPIKKNKKK